MHSLRVKIAAITIVAILTSIVSVFAACYSTIQGENDRRSVEMMNLLGQDTKQTLEHYFESIEQSVEMTANIASDSLDSVILVECGAAGTYARQGERTAEQRKRLDDYLAGYTEQVQDAFAGVAGLSRGVVTYYYCISPDISLQEHGFFFSKVGKTGFDEQRPLDARELDPADTAHTIWYYTPIQRGRPSWVGPYTAHFLGEMWIYSYLVPIYRAGALIGVLGMDIPCETLVDLVRPIQVYNTGYACLFDAEGRVLYHPKLPLGTQQDELEFPVHSDIFQKETNGSELIRYEVNGEKRQLSFSTLSNGLKLVITAPEREINASWPRLAKIILQITGVVIAFYAVLLLLAMRFITRPLRRLTGASKKLAAADYDVELDYKGKDEIGELTRAFSAMRDQQKQYIDDLNRQVNTDALTGLPNMRCFFILAEAEKRCLREDGRHPAILFFDLIGMKHFNRQYGFDEGNRLICAIAEILARHFGENRVSHISQDHFAAITNEERLEEELRAVFRDCSQANGGVTLPVRVGIYQEKLEEMEINVALDCAKYASDQHRDIYESGFCYFDKTMLKQAENVRYVISHLDQAIREQWIQVFYQPIIRSVNGRVCDEEALSRWMDPVLGTLSPGDFIPILENARLIYKLDLYVVDQVLEKIREEMKTGLSIVPHSVNLSRSDFDACDIVEEIRSRVDAAGISRDRITIEITESIIGSDFDFMKEQVGRFQKLGFPVWMDDFGSGYSSLDVLQSIKFDLIKFDMSFMKRLDEGDGGKIILTELMKMATALGVDTICEGVETEEQVRFLQEIGCSKLQGFYFCKAISLEGIIERNKKGIQIGYENPAESAYYEAIGRVNLYDLAAITTEEENNFRKYFSTLPMGIMEVTADRVRYVRTNQAYRDFMARFFGHDVAEKNEAYPVSPDGPGASFMKRVIQCCQNGSRAFLDEQMPDGSIVHSFVRHIITNPVTGTMAAAVAVLQIAEPDDHEDYARIARALASDYYKIYCVDLDRDEFIEYTSPVDREELAVERYGENFFDFCNRNASRIQEQDRKTFFAAFTRENILRTLDQQGAFTATYRLTDTEEPVYASVKITRQQPGSSKIIMGISVLDAQMEKSAEEGTTA